MKNTVLTFVLVFTLIGVSLQATNGDHLETLSLERPDIVKLRIAESAKNFGEFTKGNPRFRHYKTNPYSYSGIDPEKFLKTLVRKSTDKTKTIRVLNLGDDFLDIGVKNLVRSLNSDKTLMAGKAVHFVNLSIEPYSGQRYEQVGNCRICRVGGFPIEDLIEGFTKQNDKYLAQLAGGECFDWIVSKAFIALTDPAGTFLRAHKLLKLGGYMFMRGFPILYDGRSEDKHLHGNVLQFLEDTGEKYLVRNSGMSGERSLIKGRGMAYGLYEFLLLKERKTLSLPLTYNGVQYSSIGSTKGQHLAKFKRHTPFLKWNDIQLPHERDCMGRFCGNKDLFNWFSQGDFRGKYVREYEYASMYRHKWGQNGK